MATTLRDVRPPALTETPQPLPHAPARRPFRDNPRLILLGILVLLVALVAMVTLADRAPDFNPNFLTEVLLYALSVADLTMLLALGFVLARNIVKLLVERRHGLPFSRFMFVRNNPFNVHVYGTYRFLTALDERFGLFSRTVRDSTHLDDPLDYSMMAASL